MIAARRHGPMRSRMAGSISVGWKRGYGAQISPELNPNALCSRAPAWPCWPDLHRNWALASLQDHYQKKLTLSDSIMHLNKRHYSRVEAGLEQHGKNYRN